MRSIGELVARRAVWMFGRAKFGLFDLIQSNPSWTTGTVSSD